jgi:hypothetical protein
MRQSQVPDELGDDAIDKMDEFLKKWNNWLTFDNLRLAERYQKGELCLHLRVARNDGMGPTEHFCARLQKFDVWPLPKGFHFPRTLQRHGRVGGGHCNQETMLVDVVQFMDQPKITVPSLMRLGLFEKTNCGLGDSLYFGLSSGFQFVKESAATSPILEDWEGMLVGGGSSRSLDKLPDEMIKARPQVVENISNDDGKSRGNWRARLNTKNFVAGLRVILGVETVRVLIDEKINPGIEFDDLLFGPFNFCPDAK